MEAAEFGIRVNTVCPGAVETALLSLEHRRRAPTRRAGTATAIRNRYALGRIAEPDEIAAAIFWLSGAGVVLRHRHALAVDGGRTFH